MLQESRLIEVGVDAALLAFGVTYKATYKGECDSPFGANDRVDHYRVSFGAYATDFYQGLGLRKPGTPIPVAPTAASVLYCLLGDAEAVDMSFPDWADNFGFDADSIKALRTYEKCCEAGQALRKIFTRAQQEELAQLLEGY